MLKIPTWALFGFFAQGFLIWLLLVVIFGSSQPPSPRPTISAQHEQTQTSPTDQKGAGNQRGSERAPVFVKVLPTPESEKEARENAADREQSAANERWLIGTNVLLVIFTGILAVFTGKLWLSTDQLVSGAEDVAKRQLRAYVGVEKFAFECINLNDPNRIPEPFPVGYIHQDFVTATVRNFGQTPAYDVTVFTYVIVQSAWGVRLPPGIKAAWPSVKSGIIAKIIL